MKDLIVILGRVQWDLDVEELDLLGGFLLPPVSSPVMLNKTKSRDYCDSCCLHGYTY